MFLLASIARPHLKVNTQPPFDAAVFAIPNLVAWWKADEASGTTMIDYSGNGLNATYIPGANLAYRQPPLRAGSLGCVQLTSLGNNPAANVAATGALALGVTSGSTFTIGCFVKKLGGGSTLQKVFGWGPLNYGVNESGPNIGYRDAFFPGKAGGADGGLNRVYSSNNTAGTIVFLAWVKNGTTFTLYENGTSAATETPTFAPPHYSVIEMLGTSSPSPNPPDNEYNFVGYGSDFLVYGDALNSTQLQSIAHAGGLI